MNKNAKSFLIGVVIGLPLALFAVSQQYQEEPEQINFEKYIVKQDVETEVFGVDSGTDFVPGYYEEPQTYEPYPGAIRLDIEATAYCYGEITASGKRVRKGMAAMAKEYMGKTAIVYTPDFELIGIYEVEDTGGDYRIKNGQCIDIYIPDYDSCIEFGRQDVIVYLMDAKG